MTEAPRDTVAELAVEVDPGAEDRAARRERRFLRSSGAKVLVAGEIILILLLWEWASGVARIVNPVFLPPPSEFAASTVELFASGEIYPHLLRSVTAWSAGLALALLVAVPIGMLVGRSYAAHRLAGPFIWSLYATPWLAYQPLSKVWFGFGLAPVIFLVFIAALFPTLLNTAAGVGTTRPSLVNAARVFGADQKTILRKVILPSSLPLMLAGIRQSVAMATIALIVAEMAGPSVGVGTLIITKTQARQVDEAFAGILVAVIWTLLMTYLVKLLGQRLAPWQRDARTG
jgi:NitT/TauT family transport system permease protein